MSRPWYSFYPDAYDRKAGDLSYVQDSAYRRLLDQYYKTGKPLSLDHAALHRACKAMSRDERKAIDFCLATFFAKGPDGYRNDRADEEISKAEAISSKRSAAAQKRHGKSDANAHANADQFAEQKDTHLHSTATEERSPLRGDAKPRARPRRSLPEDFPGEPDQQWAKDHWLAKGRADLCSGMAEEIAKFRDHHTGRATMSADWSGSWRTWVRNAMNFTRAPAAPMQSRFPTAQILKVV